MRKLFLCLLLTFFSIGVYSQYQKSDMQTAIATELEELCSYSHTLDFNRQTDLIDLQGAWKLVQVQQLKNNSFVTVFPGKYTGEQVKIWSGNQVMFIGRYRTDSGTEEQYGHGTFKISGNNSEEVLKIFSYKEWEGKKIKLKMEMRGDTLVQIFPLNEKFEVDKNTKNIEKYLKIK